MNTPDARGIAYAGGTSSRWSRVLARGLGLRDSLFGLFASFGPSLIVGRRVHSDNAHISGEDVESPPWFLFT